jgi:hypothetical protein
MNKCIKNRGDILIMLKRFDKIKKLSLLKPDKYLMVMILRELKMDNITHLTFEGRYDRDYIFMWFLNLSLISKMPNLAHLSMTFPVGELRLIMKLTHLFTQLPLSHRLTSLTLNLPYLSDAPTSLTLLLGQFKHHPFAFLPLEVTIMLSKILIDLALPGLFDEQTQLPFIGLKTLKN